MSGRKLFFLSVLGLSFSYSFSAQAELVCNQKELLAVFRQASAMKASCLPSVDHKAVLLANDVVFTKYWDQSESRSIVGRLVAESQRLTPQGSFQPFRKFAVEVDEHYRILGQQVTDPQLGRPKVIIQEPGNVSLYAHEMGHIIGNTMVQGKTWYATYNSAVPQPCHLSCYAKSGYDKGRRNEEFAEVTSAYLTQPQLLQQGGAACQKAFQFFRMMVFPKKDPTCLKPVVVIPPKPVVVAPKPVVTEAKPATTEAKPTTAVKPVVPETKPAVTEVKPEAKPEAKSIVTTLGAKAPVTGAAGTLEKSVEKKAVTVTTPVKPAEPVKAVVKPAVVTAAPAAKPAAAAPAAKPAAKPEVKPAAKPATVAAATPAKK